MNDLLLNPQTRAQIDSFIQSPSHALILIGSPGSGKLSLAQNLSSRLLSGNSHDKNQAYLKLISPEGTKQIGIESIRELEHFLSLKVPSRNAVNRIVILENSHLLSIQAQNALLKTLEEPPQGTVILLTASHSEALLSTILSRSQQIVVERPALGQLREYFKQQGNSDDQIKQALAISGGLPGLAQALLSGIDHPLVSATEKARELLGQSMYERLAQVDELARQRTLCTDVLFILQQMAHISLQTNSGTNAKRWQTILKASYEASEALVSSAQPKLVLCNFMLSI